MQHPESKLQIACKTWFNLQYPKLKRLLFAIPNGGARGKIEASIMKGEGVEAGVSDMMLAVPRHGWAGAFIENKVGKNRPTELQLSWQSEAAAQGYATTVIYSLDEFISFVENYLSAITPKQIENVTCRHYNIPSHILHSKSQKREITEPRQVIMTLMHAIDKSNNAAAEYFVKDHATSTHARKVIADLYATNKEFKGKLDRIMHDLNIMDQVIISKQ